MAIPLPMKLFWLVYSKVDFVPSGDESAAKVRAHSERRKRAGRLPGASLINGRADRGARAEDAIATVQEGLELPIRVYRPVHAAPGPLPVVVNFHGGGFVSGDARQSEWLCSTVAAQAGVVVVSVDYRLAPEHPYPAAPEDCYAATVWVHDHADELGVDAGLLAVMGDSAGGNLAAVVSLMARDRGGPPIALQVLIYPGVELIKTFPSEDENAHAPILGKDDVKAYSALYRAGSDGGDPYASPLRADHHDLPPALIQTAEHDPLRDQGPEYAAVLRAAGVAVRLTNYVDAVHGYMSLPGLVPAARQAVGEIVDELRERFTPQR